MILFRLRAIQKQEANTALKVLLLLRMGVGELSGTRLMVQLLLNTTGKAHNQEASTELLI